MTQPTRAQCPRCERSVRLTTKGAIGRHDRGAWHRHACAASGHDHAAEVELRETKGWQPA